jgi:anti-sigma regulatory factor (Ser/Thr protein kinase)
MSYAVIRRQRPEALADRRKQVMLKGGSTLQVAAEVSQLETIRNFVEQHCAALRVDPSAAYDLLLAVEEIATNSIVHGYRRQPGTIDITVRQVADGLEISLRDYAPPFDPTQIRAPDLSAPLARRPLGKMGIHLARQLVDSMTYDRTPAGANQLILAKRRIIPAIPQEEVDAPDS